MLTPFHFGVFVALGFVFALTLGRKGPWGKFFGWLLLFVLGAVGLTHTATGPDLVVQMIAYSWSGLLCLLPLWWLGRWIAAPRVRF